MDKYDIIERIESELRDCDDRSIRAQPADLHHTLYNTGYAYVYYGNAAAALSELGTFECIRLVREYEQFHFGEVYTDLSDPCKVANMLVYIGGYALLDAVQRDLASAAENLSDDDPISTLAATFDRQPNRDMTDEELETLQAFTRRWLEDNPNWWVDWRETWV